MVESSSTSSFIPKNANKVRKPRTSKRIYIFSYLSYVFFFGTLITVVGVYFYVAQTKGTLEEQKQILATERTRFSDSDIEYVRDLEKRLLLTERLLDQSAAPSRIFTSLEEIIVDSVRVTGITYERDSNNTFVLTFSGATNTFDAAIFQRQLMQSVPVFADATITTYRYGAAAEGGEGAEVPVQGNEQLVVTFENTASTSLIPYEPVVETPFENEEVFSEEGTATTTAVNDIPEITTN